MENWQQGGFGLYVHWPFCAAKCPYCDFNSHVVAAVDQDRWRRALLRDLAHWADRTPGRTLGSIFFGGGTPSLIPPDTVAAIVEAARSHWTPANDLEVTLEANPTSTDAARFAGYADAGVNRISVGVQALRDGDLRALGRLHDAREARRAVEVATRSVDRVSFDLIYGRQGQTVDAWDAELREALAIGVQHLALYQLTIEDGTAFGARHAVGRLPGLPDEDRAVALWEVTQALCDQAGLGRYEVSNHSRPGAECRHNLTYWRGGDWIAIGPGAHGRVSRDGERHATTAWRLPADWLTIGDAAGVGTEEEALLTVSEIVDEYVLMGLRRREGIDLARLDALGGRIVRPVVDDLQRDGLVSLDAHSLTATERGILVLDWLLGRGLVEPA